MRGWNRDQLSASANQDGRRVVRERIVRFGGNERLPECASKCKDQDSPNYEGSRLAKLRAVQWTRLDFIARGTLVKLPIQVSNVVKTSFYLCRLKKDERFNKNTQIRTQTLKITFLLFDIHRQSMHLRF